MSQGGNLGLQNQPLTGPALEVGLVGIHQARDIALVARVKLGCGQQRVKFRPAGVDPADIFFGPAQHEVLLVAPHHQHLHGQGVEFGLCQALFNRMDGRAQIALQTAFLIETDFLLQRHHSGKLLAVGTDARGQAVEGRGFFLGGRHGLHGVEAAEHAVNGAVIFLRIGHVPAHQEVLLAPAHFQGSDFHFLGKRCLLREDGLAGGGIPDAQIPHQEGRGEHKRCGHGKACQHEDAGGDAEITQECERGLQSMCHGSIPVAVAGSRRVIRSHGGNASLNSQSVQLPVDWPARSKL